MNRPSDNHLLPIIMKKITNVWQSKGFKFTKTKQGTNHSPTWQRSVSDNELDKSHTNRKRARLMELVRTLKGRPAHREQPVTSDILGMDKRQWSMQKRDFHTEISVRRSSFSQSHDILKRPWRPYSAIRWQYTKKFLINFIFVDLYLFLISLYLIYLAIYYVIFDKFNFVSLALFLLYLYVI